MSLRDDEAGTGTVSMLAGLAVFLGFLLFAVQVTTHLYASSTVNAAAFEAARVASGSGPSGDTVCARPPAQVQAMAEERLGRLLGGLRNDADVDWSGSDTDTVRVSVAVPSPARLVSRGAGVIGLGTIERTVALRTECVR